MSGPAEIAPVTKRVVVSCDPGEAFRVFTEEIGAWWPLESHSIEAMDEGGTADGAVLEPRVGGELYEVMSDGTRGHWATVVTWEPPRRLVLAWKPNPARPAATEVEVRFVPDDAGTRVELEHRGWEGLGDEGPESRHEYDTGWVGTLDRYAAHAAGV